MKTGVSFPPRIDGSDDRYQLRLEIPPRRAHQLKIITLKSSAPLPPKKGFAEKKKEANLKEQRRHI
jgi:hypothetical protein